MYWAASYHQRKNASHWVKHAFEEMKMSTETFVLEAFGGKGKFKTKETNVALLKYYNSAL